MGKPGWRNPVTLGMRGEPGEVKHLSSPRRRNRRDSLSSGERKGKSLNRRSVKTAVVAFSGLWVKRERWPQLPGESEKYMLVELYWESEP